VREKLAAISLDELQGLTGAGLVVEGTIADLSVPEL
jgi:3-oxoadipate CoA-transferase beta subunit